MFNFGVISDTFAATFTQDCQMQKIAAQNTGISQSKACRESEQLNETVDKVLSPIKFIFLTLLTIIASMGAITWFWAALEAILDVDLGIAHDDEFNSPLFGWLALLVLVVLMFFIFGMFAYSPYGLFKWSFTIIFCGGVVFVFVEGIIQKIKKKKTPAKKKAVAKKAPAKKKTPAKKKAVAKKKKNKSK